MSSANITAAVQTQLYSFLTSVLYGGGWSMPSARYFTPMKEPWFPSYRRISGPQGWFGHVWRTMYLIPPPGFEPWTFQPIVSRYTDFTLLSSLAFSWRGNTSEIFLVRIPP
jgi:hypothetical protein